MQTRVATFILGIAMAGLALAPAAAKDAAQPANAAAPHAKVEKQPADKLSAAGDPGTHKSGKDNKGNKGKVAKAAPPSAALSAFAAMPAAERGAIQSDLAFLGDYQGLGGDIDEATVEAVRAFQRRNNGKDTGILTVAERDQLAAAAKTRADAVGWRLIEDPATGANIGLPGKLVPQVGSSRTGGRWTSAQGQIQIETFRLREAALPVLFEEEKKASQRRVGASALGPSSFVISGVQGLKNFLVRAQAKGGEVRGITILYDQATQGIMGSVAVATAAAFDGFPDPNVPAPPGLRRAVEYGTAIVVSGKGDLIAPARITDECQSIAVPGLGHADRVAADKNNEVALLRLYSARNLAAALLNGASAQATELTVVGIADPLAQAGGGAVTHVGARLAAQSIEPAPKPGFAGAAALDAQGRLIGMVEFRPAAGARSAAAAGPQAALVPVETIRTFLQAQGVSPAATGGAPIEQSVLRVVCVHR